MCVVSMVMDQWWPKHPQPEPFDPYKTLPQIPQIIPNAIPWPMIQKDPQLAEQMLEVLKRLEAIDKKLGLLEQCSVSEPDKKKVKAKLRRIAKKAKHRSGSASEVQK